MSAQPSMAPPQPDLGGVSVRLASDPAGKLELPGLPKLYVAIHVGRSVYMACSRGGQRHRGLLVHGDIDIIPAQTPSIWEPEEPDTALVVGMEPALLNRVAEDNGVYPDRIEILNRFQIRDPQIEAIGWALKAEMDAGFPSGRVFREGLAVALASCLVRRHSSIAGAPRIASGSLSGRRLKQVLAYIEDNLAETLSLGDIAAVAGVSMSHFKVIFRQAMGVPVHQYIIQRRVERARELLVDSQLPISEIAQVTGFTHQSHLASHMRRILGHSPKAVRNLAS